MSYSIHLVAQPCPTCGSRAEPSFCPDPTYNLTPIFDLALSGEGLPNPDVAEVSVVIFGQKTDRPRGLRLLNGRTARDTIPELDRAIERLADEGRRAEFVALEPENGWGTLRGATEVIRQLRQLADTYPNNRWDVR